MSYPTNVVFILTGLFIYCQADTCADKLPDCAAYTKSACQGPYVIWAYENCRAFCGLCRKECVNKRSDCHEFGRGMCHAPYETWARQNCANYCGFCGSEYECLFTPWMELIPCSKSCGGGTKTQVRSFTLVPKGTPLAKDCNNSLIKSTVCNLKACPTKPPPTPGKQVVGEVVPDVVPAVVAATAAKVAETAAAEAAAAAAAEAAAAAAAETAAVVAGETAAVVAGETAAIAGTAVLAETGILAGIEMFLPLLAFFGKRDISDETRAFEDLIQSVLKRQNVD